ncbi:MAG: hypothetical protein N5P05_001281 [Chroococcopsis gigantea SAG 12.99]|jgi:succinyl-CoA synthetase beta subunit|nr:acetate--CoA ligase family protein [Chlorogloea purpurea SAG 13.99]MDV2999675.1 hypothetical protein [Chroococcopsis gigantea SAG 12.99]
MDLLEYQAKELFQEVGIPILPSQPIHDTSELKRLNIPYPVVLKSQVRSGGRGKAGGIKFVANTIDAIAASHAIFSLAISGEYPEVILAEARYNAQQEVFLAIVLDYQRQRPVLLGSSRGGMNVENLLASLQQVPVDEEFSPFYARRLATKMGLTGSLLQSVSGIIEKMYSLFVSKDLDIIEINPLGVNEQGEVMALDGKIAVNDYAIDRHPELIPLTLNCELPYRADANAPVAIVSNQLGLALSTWDLIHQKKSRLAGWIVLDEINPELNPLDYLKTLPDLKTILVNLSGNGESVESLAIKIVEYLGNPAPTVFIDRGQNRDMRPTRANPSTQGRTAIYGTEKKISPKIIVRLMSDRPLEQIQTRLSAVNVEVLESLEQAVKLAL